MDEFFADQHHVEQVRRRLWCGREYGQASVFVGAGFSRNAYPISPNTPPFALWSDVTNRMFETLYPASLFKSEELRIQARLRATAGSGVLRIAQEFELSLGRQALEELLHESIPDNDYKPGRLHEILLSLPWSDVFTTNYDTLLERTRHRIYDRKYEVVVTPLDIPSAMKPRIVKLHGSFPSNRPYIITEEDFRTYPVRFGPFVNTVQQAIMENSLCLLGFSGDDPNFLYWSGWVRDNLGASAPPIYLIGLLDLSPSQRKILESRRVIPIDLSPMFPLSKWPNPSNRHQKAMEWILLTLSAGAPTVTVNWPMQRTEPTWESSEGLPAIPAGPTPLTGPGPAHPPSHELTIQDLASVKSTWARIRVECPGWLILPEPNRSILWHHTVSWIGPIVNSINLLPLHEQLEMLFELNWRIYTSLRAVSIELLRSAEVILSAINPFPTIFPVGETQLTPGGSATSADWGHLSDCWVDLAFSLLRHYRDQQDQTAFEGWIERLRAVVKQKREWTLRWHHEQCLYSLNYGSILDLEQKVQSWPAQGDIPIWELRRAAILAEIGSLSEAETIAEMALMEIRTRIRPYSTDLGPLSEEGWAMLLLNTIRSNSFEDESQSGQFRDRWDKLGQYRCNPWTILDEAEAGLLKTPQQQRSVNDVPSAYFLSRVFEQAGMPIRCGSTLIKGDSILSAAQQIWPHFPLWALSIMLRVGKDRELREWLDETRIASMPTKDAADLCNRLIVQITGACKAAARDGEGDLWSPSLPHRQLSALCELLSGLCFRLTAQEKFNVVDLACAMYRVPWMRSNYLFHRPVESLFKSLMPQLLPSELLVKMNQLLELPIPGDSVFEVAELQMWPEPFQYIRWGTGPIAHELFPSEGLTKPIKMLIGLVETGAPEERGRAVARLSFLYKIGVLNGDWADFFGKALWSRLDPKTGLPVDTGLRQFAVFNLPSPDQEVVRQRYKDFILSGDFHRSISKIVAPNGTVNTSFGFGFYDDAYHYELLGSSDLFASETPPVSWSREEAELLLDKAQSWWVEEGKVLLESGFLDLVGQGAHRAELLVRVLSRVIFPRLKGSNRLESVTSLLEDIERAQVSVLAALPSSLFLSTQNLDSIIHRLRSGLNSLRGETVGEAVKGVYVWMAAHAFQLIPEPAPDLVKECVDIVTSRRQPGLDTAISIVTDMIERFPEAFTTHLSSLYLALEYLHAATTVPGLEESTGLDDVGVLVPLKERIRYRTRVARLAARIHQFLEPLFGNGTAQIITKWQETAQASNIASIRRAWL